MPAGRHRFSPSWRPVLAAVLLASLPIIGTQAQNARLFIEVWVHADDQANYETACSSARAFLEAMNIEGLRWLQPAASGYVDARELVSYLPPPLAGSYGYAETIEGPGINDDMLVPCAHVKYFRGESTWDEVTVDIIDVGPGGSSQMRNMHLSGAYREHCQRDTIQGCEATVLRVPYEGDGYEVQIALEIPAGYEAIDWETVLATAMEGTRRGVAVWSLASRFTEGRINGSKLLLPAGALTGPEFTDHIIAVMRPPVFRSP